MRSFADEDVRFLNYGSAKKSVKANWKGYILVLIMLFLISFAAYQTSESGESDDVMTQPEQMAISKELFGEESDSEEEEEEEENEPSEEIHNCTKEAFAHLTPGTYAYLEKEANCGSGFSLEPSNRPYHVHLFGHTLGITMRLTGCSIGSHCPLYPNCKFTWGKTKFSKELYSADMVMVTNFEGTSDMQRLVYRTKKQKDVVRVLHWRESYWPYVDPVSQKRDYDIIMGAFQQAELVSPPFFRRPNSLLHARHQYNFLPFEQRTEFAISIISNCNPNSRR